MQLVVVVEQGDELAPGHRQGVVGGGDDAAVRTAVLQPDPRVAALSGLELRPYVRVARGVVDEAQLPVAEALALDRAQHRPQDVWPAFRRPA